MELKNKRHERFCREYVKDHNATKAYKRAGYKVNAEMAKRSGSRLLTYVDVKDRIVELEQIVIKKIEVSTDEIYEGYRKILDTCGVKYKKKIGGKQRTILIDPKSLKGALDSLARIKGMFNDNLHVTGLTFAEAIKRRKEELAKGT